MSFSSWAKNVLGISMGEKGDTFSTLNAKIENIKLAKFEDTFEWLYEEVKIIKTDRENFYRSLRRKNSWWINTSQWILSILGATALLLTALAGISTVVEIQETWLKGWQARGLFWAFIIYTVMGAIALFERGTNLSASYFRHLTITMAIRNLWNEYQLSMLKEYPVLLKLAETDEIAARDRAIELARALCKDIDTLVSTEQTEWRIEYTESRKELDTAANAGLDKAKTDLEAAMVKVTKAVEEATKAAEQAKTALLPGDFNVTVTGEFDGNLVVLVDQVKRHDKPVMKKFALRGIAPGTREFEVKAKKGNQDINLSEVVEVKPGLQSHTITLP